MQAPKLQALPIDPYLPEILQALKTRGNLVLQASPGSGKTTRVPPYLLDSGLLNRNQEILVLVPRRLAAKMAAMRVAEERGEEIGQAVGYQFRFENVSGPNTRLKFLTEGMLLRYLMKDHRLSRAGAVILDEFHERHLHSDVALSYLRHLQRQERPDLHLIIMSATLETEGLAKFLGEAPVLKIEAPAFPVAVEYLPGDPQKPLEYRVREALRAARSRDTSGDVLIFLPGMAEIRRCAEELERCFGSELLILPLHGELPREAQARVFHKADRTKVILATNVAETSLTIDGVTVVLDSGLHRQASFSWWNGIPALKTRPISKASSTQRAGRAGRTAPGLCLRLYSKGDWEARVGFETPELRRSDLTPTLLEIKAMGVDTLSRFPWFEAPSSGALQSSTELLFQLGATRGPELDAPLTPLGERMAELPVHPRLARLLLEAEHRQVLKAGTMLAALINEDALEGLDIFEQVQNGRMSESVARLQRQLLGYFPAQSRGSERMESDLAYALLSAFPDRVAKRRDTVSKTNEVDLVFCNGGAGSVRAESLGLAGEFFVVLDVQERQGQGQMRAKVHVRSLCSIPPEWLFDWQGSWLQEKTELSWDEKLGRLFQVTRITYGALVLSEAREAPRDVEAAESFFLREVLRLDLQTSDSTSFQASDCLTALARFGEMAPVEEIFSRLSLLKQQGVELQGVDVAGQGLRRWLRETFHGVVAATECAGPALASRLLAALPPAVSVRLGQLFPTSVSLTGGRKVKVHYPWGKPPWIESRLQDFFGMKVGPQLAEGKIPLTLHLLAPNRRAVQVTSDLASFWKNTYPQVRQELKRRYPRHAWPEQGFSDPK